MNRKDIVKFAGKCFPWGKDPHGAPEYDGGNPAPFRPAYITLVHIELAKDWKLFVNHASYSAKDLPDTNSRMKKAIEIFEAKIPAGGARMKFSDPALRSHGPYQRKNSAFDVDDFSPFGFNSQHEIFIFLESPEITIKSGDLISFTPLDVNEAEMAENYAFFNAETVDLTKTKLAKRGRMMRVENHFTDEKAQPLDDKDPAKAKLYAMNIHFRTRGYGSHYMPIIIDPNTGNGAGNEP